MTDKVHKIREEVERLKSQLLRGACSSQISMETMCKEEAYNEVLAILDTMQKEPVSEDLEEAAEAWSNNDDNTGSCDYIGVTVCEYAFKAGAKWQKWKIMAKAKSGTVQKDNQVILDNGTYIDLDPSMQLKPSFVGLKEGDRIKVIVIKD